MKQKDLYIPSASLWITIIFLWTFVLGNLKRNSVGAYEIVGSMFFTIICSSYLMGLGRKVVRESCFSAHRKKLLVDRGVVCFPWLTIMSCITVAWALSTQVTGLIPIKYSYTIGSILFLPMFVIIFIRRKDLRPVMWFFGLVGIPSGCLIEYCFYGRDWWHAVRIFPILEGRLGPADVIYSFFHGALLTVSGLFFLQMKVNFNWRINDGMKQLIKNGLLLAVFVTTVIFVTIQLTGLPSFYIVSIVFTMTGFAIILLRPDLLKLSLAGALLTICWSAPVYFILNTVSPGWIESFWISNTGELRILGIPLLDLLWYASAGFGAGPVIPFLLNTKIVSINHRN